MTNRIPQNRIEQIEAILSRLEALADVRPDDDPGRAERVAVHWPSGAPGVGIPRSDDLPVHGCGVKREHRDGVRTYVESWITDDVRSLLDWARGETTR
jgi:hypothetical protein